MRATTVGRLLAGLAVAGAAALAACTLDSTSLATPEDVVVAEVVLRAGERQQFALLHRTIGSNATGVTVPGAAVTVTGPRGGPVPFSPVAARDCIGSIGSDRADSLGSCYATEPGALAVVPGGRYSLRIEVDGGVLQAVTDVPQDFRIVQPDTEDCVLPPDTVLPVRWTRSAGTWAYLAETRLIGLRDLLPPGVRPRAEPVDLTGLSIAAADTTILFPTEFGVFDRFDSTNTATLKAIQHGLPEGTAAMVVVGAADRNLVDWLRGSEFHPSGLIRIPSVQGDGTGVFGSIVSHAFRVRVMRIGGPACYVPGTEVATPPA
ncbi:MAG: hypothetical protein IRZ00_17895 [Gemmatimonadetes bacterium]|nr:hypothetical protein [Gemmatimonadota bacterium]